VVIFAPAGTNYEMRLLTSAPPSSVPVGQIIECFIRASAKKLWTVPSGGNFIAPIFGQPRTLQGRVRYLDERQMVLHCGTSIIVALPAEDCAFDLTCGPLTVLGLANAVAMPGATFELAASAALAAPLSTAT
jgi:hypothetical protein